MIKNPREKICAFCRNFTFKPRSVPGWSYCEFFKKHFENPHGWAKDDGSKPPGKRSCPHWE